MDYYLTSKLVSFPYKVFKKYFPKNVFEDRNDDEFDYFSQAENYWYKKWRRTIKAYYWPYAPEIEDKFMRFENHVLKRFLLVPTGIDEEFVMTYHIPQHLFENVESLMFLLKCYFEGVSMQVSIDFNFHYENYKSYAETIQTSGAYGNGCREELIIQYEGFKKDYIRHLYCTIPRGDPSVNTGNLQTVFKLLSLEIKCRTPEEYSESGG